MIMMMMMMMVCVCVCVCEFLELSASGHLGHRGQLAVDTVDVTDDACATATWSGHVTMWAWLSVVARTWMTDAVLTTRHVVHRLQVSADCPVGRPLLLRPAAQVGSKISDCDFLSVYSLHLFKPRNRTGRVGSGQEK